MVKPDVAFHFGSLIVVIEADDSKSRGNNISKHYGTESQYSATLNLCAFQAVMYALRQWWNPTKMAFVDISSSWM
jgi:hypothetical protein